ncbi:hypothetical protein [Runella sp.]|uniref:hypothetical protein n=1 Tax=Runella sp. TaxID=1960881 RepID=UPI003D0A50C1
MFTSILTSHFIKYLGIFLTIIGTPILFLDRSHGSELPLLLGLFFIFISREKVEDERSYTIRVSSLTIAFLVGYVIEQLTSYFFDKGFISWHLTEIKHFIIIVFGLAIILFYARLYADKE